MELVAVQHQSTSVSTLAFVLDYTIFDTSFHHFHLTLLILLPFSGMFTCHWEATRTVVRTSSPTDASHL
jgi:hypothetical protein